MKLFLWHLSCASVDFNALTVWQICLQEHFFDVSGSFGYMLIRSDSYFSLGVELAFSDFDRQDKHSVSHLPFTSTAWNTFYPDTVQRTLLALLLQDKPEERVIDASFMCKYCWDRHRHLYQERSRLQVATVRLSDPLVYSESGVDFAWSSHRKPLLSSHVGGWPFLTSSKVPLPEMSGYLLELTFPFHFPPPFVVRRWYSLVSLRVVKHGLYDYNSTMYPSLCDWCDTNDPGSVIFDRH